MPIPPSPAERPRASRRETGQILCAEVLGLAASHSRLGDQSNTRHALGEFVSMEVPSPPMKLRAGRAVNRNPIAQAVLAPSISVFDFLSPTRSVSPLIRDVARRADEELVRFEAAAEGLASLQQEARDLLAGGQI